MNAKERANREVQAPQRAAATAAIFAVAIFAGCAGWVDAAQRPAGRDVEVLHVRDAIYMIVAGGTNITASIGPDGVLLVDTGPAELAEPVRTAIRGIQQRLATFKT